MKFSNLKQICKDGKKQKNQLNMGNNFQIIEIKFTKYPINLLSRSSFIKSLKIKLYNLLQSLLKQHYQKILLKRMGNNQNNTVIEYWTKTGIKICYLFWDLKGKNRFSEPPSEHEVNSMFEKCLQEIDISSYQINIVKEFTPKYKYRFVSLHNRKVNEHIKEREIQKYSRESYRLQIVESVKTVESQKKMRQLESLVKGIELNQTSIKTSLINVDKFISECKAQNEFLQVKGIQRLLQLLDLAAKSNDSGTKASFASQIELLKFFRYFSQKYTKQFYSYLSRVKSYPHVILKTYHPINTQIIAYSLHLLSEYSWRVEDETTLILIMEKNRIAMCLDSFLAPIIQSILQSDSIVSVYHNLKFVNDLMASALSKADKQILDHNLFHTKYSLVLQNVKIRLQTMFYSIQKTTFISVYQKIFKYSIQKQNSKQQQSKIQNILEQNLRKSTALNINNKNSLQNLHETVIAFLIKSEADRMSDLDHQNEEDLQIPTYLTQNDRRNFNRVVFEALTEMQKFYKLEFYLQTSEDEQMELEFNRAENSIDSRIVQHSLQTYFSKIKQECQQNKCIQVLNNCLKKIQFYGIKEWEELEKFVYEEPQQRKKKQQELEELKIVIDDKQSRIKTLIKELSELKAKNQQLTLSRPKSQQQSSPSLNLLLPPPPLLLPPSPILQSSLTLSQSTNSTKVFNPLSLPPLPLPPLPIIPGIELLKKQKQKEKRKPPKALKNCNYIMIPYDKIKDSIFEEIDDTKVEINQNELVNFFAKNTPQQASPIKRQASLQSTYLTQSKLSFSPSQKQSIRLLKADRQKNIEIVLIKLKIPKRQMKKVLYECSGKFASQHTLQVIEKLLPTEQEEQAIKSFDGNEEDLGVSQRFLKELIQIPAYANRIKSMIFCHIREEIYFEVQSKAKRLKEAFISLRTNNTLKYIIQQCLAIGNYLNGQSVKGGAWGFKLETIQRLQEVKSEDKDMNGALYLIKEVWKQFDYPLFDKNQLELYHYISKIPISQIKHEIGELQKYITAIDKACSSKDPQNTSDKIVDFCQNFRNQAIKKMEYFKLIFKQLTDEYIICAKYFCEDGKALSSDEFGKKMYQCVFFVSNTQKIWKLISEKNVKMQKQKAAINKVSYIQLNDPEKNRESAIDLKVSSYEFDSHIDLTKTSPNMHQQNDVSKQNASKESKSNQNAKTAYGTIEKFDTKNQQKNDKIIVRNSHRVSSIFEIHKPSKPMSELTEEERKKELHIIQQESVNRAMQDVLRRRTIRFQNIRVSFSKVNGLNTLTAQGTKIQQIPFLKEADNKSII